LPFLHCRTRLGQKDFKDLRGFGLNKLIKGKHREIMGILTLNTDVGTLTFVSNTGMCRYYFAVKTRLFRE
jgi:hypothetical protein